MNEIYTRREYLPRVEFTTCYSCRWSIGTVDGLHCQLTMKAACAVCPSYMREVGADEREEA